MYVACVGFELISFSPQVVVNFEGGKIVSRGDNYEVTQEMDGGRLKEVITFKGHTMTRYSKRQ